MRTLMRLKALALLATFSILFAAALAGPSGCSSTDSCPDPTPQDCEWVVPCTCEDGTLTMSSCANGLLTCDDACCGHGGALAPPPFDAGGGGAPVE
jgi:hypothetical protein